MNIKDVAVDTLRLTATEQTSRHAKAICLFIRHCRPSNEETIRGSKNSSQERGKVEWLPRHTLANLISLSLTN
jgi:hypothetical protein